jgi:hypothetical protein
MRIEQDTFTIPASSGFFTVGIRLPESGKGVPILSWAPIIGWLVERNRTIPITTLGCGTSDIADSAGNVMCWKDDGGRVWLTWCDWYSYRIDLLTRQTEEALHVSRQAGVIDLQAAKATLRANRLAQARSSL